MSGGGMLCWFAGTVAAALSAWIRAERNRSPRPWAAPLLIIVLSGVVLVTLAA